MTRTTNGTVATAAASLLLMSACSGGSSTATTVASTTAPSPIRADADGKDPCTLVTAAEAATALGGKVSPATSTFTGVYQSCSYTTDAGGTLIVTSRLIDQTGFERSIKGTAGPTPALSGLCQSAYASGVIVLGWKNGTEVDTRVVGGTRDLLSAAKTLETTACSRL